MGVKNRQQRVCVQTHAKVGLGGMLNPLFHYPTESPHQL